MQSWRQVTGYLSKYMAKPETLAKGYESPGRFWGKRNASSIPTDPVMTSVDYETSVKIKRVLRKYSKMRKGTTFRKPSGVSVYVGDGAMRRLLDFHGYYRD